MKTTLNKILMTLILTSSVSIPAFANNVAVWNSQLAISNSNFAKAKITTIQTSIKPKQQQLDTYKATVERLQNQFATQKDKLTDSQKDDIRKQIQQNLQNYEQVASQIQAIIESSENEVLQRIAPKMPTIRDTILRQKNVDVLIDNRDRTVSFVKPEWDLTADFTKAINDQIK